MARRFLVISALAVVLAACAAGAGPRNLSCEQQSHGTIRWGYYPGYGCGPVPRAQTVFP